MDKRPKISVIVPVYKAEKFLHSCVDSILAQTYENFELLLIDDGSPDGSGAICEAYAHVDERVRVFHILNSGANRARAWGVSHASNSEYITFVDSDDTLVPGALETLSLYAADDYDIIVANYERNDKKYTDREMSITEYVNHMFLCNINPSPWARLYRRTLFNESTFDLPRSFVMGEDFVMNLRLAFASQKKVRMVSAVVYHYYENAEGAMNTFRYTLEYLAQSYAFKSQAIPKAYCKECMPYCIANVLKSNHLIVRCYCETGLYKLTPLHQQVLEDIRFYGCKGMWWERFSLRFSNPLYSRFYLGVREVIIALKKIKRRLS